MHARRRDSLLGRIPCSQQWFFRSCVTLPLGTRSSKRLLFAINASYSVSSCCSMDSLWIRSKLPYQHHCPATARTVQDRLLTSQNWATAAGNTEVAQGKRKAAYDRSRRDHSLQVGHFVWVHRQEPVTDGTGKLEPKLKGIYQITHGKTPVTFVVIRITGQGPRERTQDRVVHLSTQALRATLGRALHPKEPEFVFVCSFSALPLLVKSYLNHQFLCVLQSCLRRYPHLDPIAKGAHAVPLSSSAQAGPLSEIKKTWSNKEGPYVSRCTDC